MERLWKKYLGYFESIITQVIRRSGKKEIIFDEHLCLLSSADHVGEGSVLSREGSMCEGLEVDKMAYSRDCN